MVFQVRGRYLFPDQLVENPGPSQGMVGWGGEYPAPLLLLCTLTPDPSILTPLLAVRDQAEVR